MGDWRNPRGSRYFSPCRIVLSPAILKATARDGLGWLHEAGITVTLPKPQTSGAKSDGRFCKQDFV